VLLLHNLPPLRLQPLQLLCTRVAAKRCLLLLVMALYGFLVFQGPLWSFMGFCGLSWFFVGFYGLSWSFMGFYGLSWAFTGEKKPCHYVSTNGHDSGITQLILTRPDFDAN
jgi:hypothetical protein